jgi:LysR family transcriptional regulator, low CO2-responsive transcriptional regulator
MAITLNQLASFLAVAREGSVSSAAEKLFVTQPSISAAVSALAKEVGTQLIERDGRGIALTPAGEALRPFAADVLGLIEEGKLAAREAADSSERRLRILAVATAGEFLLPSLLKSFGALHPEIDLVLEVANRATLFQRLLEHDADIAIAGRPPDDARIAGEAFLKNELVLITAPDDPFAAMRAVAPERLVERTWLQREDGSGTRQLVSEFLAAHELSPKTLTLGSNGAVKQAVQIGLGVSLQSRIAVGQDLDAGTLAEIKVRGGLPQRDWYALRPSAIPARPSVQRFVDFLKDKQNTINQR